MDLESINGSYALFIHVVMPSFCGSFCRRSRLFSASADGLFVMYPVVCAYEVNCFAHCYFSLRVNLRKSVDQTLSVIMVFEEL